MSDHESFDETRPIERSPQPPAYDPYGNPYQDPYAAPFHQAAAQPAPQAARRAAWSWRSTLAGAVAGGVIAASVAVPVSWAFAHGGGSSVADSPAAAAPQTPQTPQTPQQTQPETGDGSGGAFGYGGPGQQDQQQDQQQGGSTSSQAGNQTDATADQSQGVVLIDTTTTAGEAAGTGLVLDSSGLVLTNYHVVEGSTSVKVTIASSGDTYDATVVGHDQTADVALLQLDDASGLATIDLDESDDPAVSDAVTAVGNAQGQGFLSASTGSVVALDQSIDTQSEGTVAGEHLTGLIETDAYVVGGYSGGALLDGDGEVVGITTAASSGGQTQSYAVPIEDALGVVQQIEDGNGSDEVQVGPSAYLGVSISQQAAQSASSGVQVGQVESGGAAAGAGIEAGATITGIDDTTITSYDVLKSALATREPGDSVTLSWTDASGGTHSAKVTLGESPVN
ncbi:S1C family serine protease [Nocardioides sp. URHA0020]|uniref:S1C family serine protease n=1 Tax=Nocardioides sp. URHA0020 TaxID=1380392 RepID=UPI00068572F8|nr:trypsin-like peptidase domain-containing protein [Nocardioides sp. URHA0020]